MKTKLHLGLASLLLWALMASTAQAQVVTASVVSSDAEEDNSSVKAQLGLEVQGSESPVKTAVLRIRSSQSDAEIEDIQSIIESASSCPRQGGGNSLPIDVTLGKDAAASDEWLIEFGPFPVGEGGGEGTPDAATYDCVINITAANDFIDEGNESLALRLSRGDPGDFPDRVGSIVSKDQSFEIIDSDNSAIIVTQTQVDAETDYDGANPTSFTGQLTTSEDDDDQNAAARFWVRLATQPQSNNQKIVVENVDSDACEARLAAGDGYSAGDNGSDSIELDFDRDDDGGDNPWYESQEVVVVGRDDSGGGCGGTDSLDEAFVISVSAKSNNDDFYHPSFVDPVLIDGTNEDNDDVANPGDIRFENQTVNLVENEAGTDAQMTFTVERAGGSDGTVTVQYAVAAGVGAVIDSDFEDATTGTSAANTFEWVGGDTTSRTITVNVLADEFWEPDDETFTITLSNATGGASLDGITQKTVTIPANDPVLLTITGAAAIVEGADTTDTTEMYTITRTMGRLESGMDLTWNTMDVSTENDDYEIPANRDITITAVDEASTAMTDIISFTVKGDDVKNEGDEEVKLVIDTLPNLVTLAPGGGFSITITDDDGTDAAKGLFNMTTVADDPTFESASEVTFTIERTGNTAGEAASVTFTTSDGPGNAATGDEDYMAYAAGEKTIEFGTDENETLQFTVELIDNGLGPGGLGEDDETFTVTLEPIADGEIGVGEKTVTILADPVVRMVNATYDVDENDGTVVIEVERINPDTEAVEVDVDTSASGSAAAGDDFTAKSETLNWAAGEESTKTFTVDILADADNVGPEDFTVVLSNCTNCVIDGDTSTVNIFEGLEDTPGTLRFNPNNYVRNEEAGSVTIEVERTGGVDGAVSVGIETNDSGVGSTFAEAGADYQANSATLNWSDGQGGKQTMVVTIETDDLDENPESFEVRFVADSETGTEGDPTLEGPNANVTIIDATPGDEPGSFRVLDTGVVESDGTATVTIRREDGSDGAASVEVYTMAIGEAVECAAEPCAAGDDYVGIASGAATVLDFVDGQTEQTIDITIIDDNVDTTDASEDQQETFEVRLQNATGADIQEDATGIVTINDDDGGGVFSISNTLVYEDEAFAVLEVTRSANNGSYAQISYIAISGLPEPGVSAAGVNDDFEATAGVLTWEEGDDSTSRLIFIPIIPNPQQEGTEFFHVFITALGTGVSITDPVGRVEIREPTYPVPTFSQWSVILMVLALMGFGAHRLRGRDSLRAK